MLIPMGSTDVTHATSPRDLMCLCTPAAMFDSSHILDDHACISRQHSLDYLFSCSSSAPATELPAHTHPLSARPEPPCISQIATVRPLLLPASLAGTRPDSAAHSPAHAPDGMLFFMPGFMPADHHEMAGVTPAAWAPHGLLWDQL